MLPEFDLYMPTTVPEALKLLGEGKKEIFPVAGGTNMLVDMRAGRHTPDVLVNIESLQGMNEIQCTDGRVTVGGAVTIANLLSSEVIAQYGGSLCEAASMFASPLVRNRATVGGNLADGSPAADSAPSLLVLDSEVVLESARGKRSIPLKDFFVGVRKTKRAADELITAVCWNLPSKESRSAFYKLGLRKADAISVVSTAVLVEKNPDGTCSKARIALGSVAPIPLRVYAAEKTLQGVWLTADIIENAANLAAETCSPISDLRASAAYRRKMVKVLVRRLLTQCANPF
jgi:CO/xanthine dehydrogenase FAD-binding subunit